MTTSLDVLWINVREYRRPIKNGQSREAGETGHTRRRKTTQYVLVITMHNQTQITQIRHELSYKQLEVKTNRTSLLCRNRNGHHNTELRTWKHIIGRHITGQHKTNLKWATRTLLKAGGELKCSRRVSSSCLLQDTHHITHIYSQYVLDTTIRNKHK